MKCKYCGSTNTELVRVYKPDNDSNVRKFVYDCNNCNSVSEHVGIPDDEIGHSNVAASGHGSGFPSDDERLSERHERIENTRNALWEHGDE